MIIADLTEKLADAGFETRVNIGTELIGINARKPGISIDIFGSEHIDVLKGSNRDFTEFRGPCALKEALAYAG